MSVKQMLRVMLPEEKVKIYNDNVVWNSGVLTVAEALEIDGLNELEVGCVWISSNGYLVIDVEVA